MSEAFEESGAAFEIRALVIARAIHDPFGLQGAVMHKGQERDGLFTSDETIHAYEFTVDRTKSKADKDARKLGELLGDLSALPGNGYKTLTGWFVTRDEPTADQRRAVVDTARSLNRTIHAISISTLQQRICDSEEYLRCRENAPFGSIAYAIETAESLVNVDAVFQDQDLKPSTLDDLVSSALNGTKSLIIGDFGVGKSHALRELYRSLRKEHFRRKKLTPFPVHINLRDCAGLKTPAEILRRHADEIGFTNEKSLVSAWRAGACILLLDGFDEIVPVRWLGGAGDLRNVRWEALAPVRRLVEESPFGSGIVVCGRSHYFSSTAEMSDALGFTSSSTVATLRDFDEVQMKQYLKQAKTDLAVPEWVPTRPLLIGYLIATGALEESADGPDRAASWRNMLDGICRREARMFTAVRPETIRRIVARVATLARSAGSEIGPISMDLMRAAFIDVNGRQPDEEGLQLLLRLPGLAVEGASGSESRIFADKDLAETAYGEDLGAFLYSPHADHPLNNMASWVTAASDLGISVAADVASEAGLGAKAALAAAETRQNAHKADAVLSDILRVASELGASTEVAKRAFEVEGVIFHDLVLGDDAISGRTTYRNCVFQRVDLALVDDIERCSHFRGGMIGLLDGVSAVPAWLSGQFVEVEIEQFATSSQTTSGILQLSLQPRIKVALTILKKIYGQAGSGRKEGALSRGLDPSSRQLVPGVVSTLISEGWIEKGASGKNVQYVGVKGRRSAALRALESPSEFRM